MVIECDVFQNEDNIDYVEIVQDVIVIKTESY